jgi:hypothetical protein
MVSEPLIYSRRLASGLRTQKRERETLTLEKGSPKMGGLTFSSACSASPAPRSKAASTFVGNRGKSDMRVSTWASPQFLFSETHARPMKTIGPLRGTWRPRSCPGLGSGSWSCRTRGGPGAALGWAAGAGAAGHVVAPELPWAGQRELAGHMVTLELPWAGQRELEPQDTWRPWSCPGLGSRSWSRRTRGGPGAALGLAAGAGAAGHVVAPKLPGTCMQGYLVCRVPIADRADIPNREIGKILPIGSRSGRCSRSGDQKDISDRQNDCLIHFQKQFSIEFE